MAQTLVAYALVAGAAAWAAWQLGLKGVWKRRTAAKTPPCGDDCGCG